jgi:hypothetical protein
MTREMRGMQAVQKWGDVLPESWYHIRIASAKDKDEQGNPILSDKEQPKAQLRLLVQEEPYVGASIFDEPSLQPQALAKLKAYYDATGQGIFEDGSDDPEALVNGECYVLIKHEVYQGVTRMKIPPYGIKPLSEGKPAMK